jgi:cyclomaltodextrinase
MKDFIFGTLATEELRFKRVRNRRAGVSHSQRREPRDPLPGQEVNLELSVGPDHPCEQAWIYWTNDGSEPKGSKGVAINGNSSPMNLVRVEWDTLLWGYVLQFRGIIPGQAAGSVVRYSIAAVDLKGEEVLADEGAHYAFYMDEDFPPGWARDAIIYQIFVDRFNPGQGRDWLTPHSPAGFYGGTLRGISEQLDYLDDLGVNVLWLSPIFPSPSHHGYDATDFFEVEPRMGTKEDLHTLLDDAHRRGMHVLLDLVPNHVSNLHPTFQSAISDKDSLYAKWYIFTHWPDQYHSFFDVPELPQLNLREPAARKYVLDAAAYWLDFGVDGYRVDYASGPTPDFWADFRRVTHQTRPDCWTFGEVVEPPETQITFEGGLDGCLDFNLMEAIRKAFAYSEWTAEKFASYLIRHEAYFPQNFSRPCFLDNHDMNRYLWAAGGDTRRLRLAAMCQFSLMGAPIIYYGTEVGLSQLRDVRQGEWGLPEESRLPMLWADAQDMALLAYYRSLIQLRRNSPGFTSGRATILQADSDVLVYTKAVDEKMIVALNLSDNKKWVDLHQKIENVWMMTGEGDAVPENYGINLSPLSGAILTVS